MCDIIAKRDFEGYLKTNGGLAQLARASGSYPAGRWFKSDIRYHKRPVGQAVKTRPFHGCNMGSIPVRVTKQNISELLRNRKVVRICFFITPIKKVCTTTVGFGEYRLLFISL